MDGLETNLAQTARVSYVPSSRPRFLSRYDDAVIAGLFRSLDLFLLAAAGLLVIFVTRNLESASNWGELLLILGVGSVVAGSALHARGCYDADAMGLLGGQLQGLIPALLLGGAASGLCFGLLAVPATFVATWLPLWLLASALLLVPARIAGVRLVTHWRCTGRSMQHVAIVGATDFASSFAKSINARMEGRIKVVGTYRVGDEALDEVDGSLTTGDLNDLLARSREERIDSVVIALPAGDPRRIKRVLEALGSTIADIHVAPETPILNLGPCRIEAIGSSPVLMVRQRPLKEWQGLQKAIFDRVFSAMLLVLLAPVLAAIAIAIKLDSPGPVLFRQPRVGFNNRIFHIYKFRSMFHHLADRDADEQTKRGDSRVTKVGRILRKLSFDELPQLLNTLRGEMSLVGPRPHALNTRADNVRLEDVSAAYLNRHRVRPGITGWAQVNGCRGELKTAAQVHARIEHDIYYIENWSLLFDLRILVLTVVREIISKRAF